MAGHFVIDFETKCRNESCKSLIENFGINWLHFLLTPVRWFSMQIYNRTVLKNTNSPSHSTYFEKEKEYQISIYFTEIKLHDDF